MSDGREGKARISCGIVRRVVLLAIAILGTTAQVQGQTTPPNNPLGSVCNFVYHRSVVEGETLYVDGGSYYDVWYSNKTNNPGGLSTKLQNEFLWKVDLSTNWAYDNPPWSIEAKPLSHSEHYNGYQGTIWSLGQNNEGSFHTLNGELEIRQGPPPGSYFGPPLIEDNVFRLPTRKMFKYTPGNPGTWSGKDVPTTIPKVTKAAWASSKRHGLGFALGGMVLSEQFNIPATGAPPSGYTTTMLATMTIYNSTSDKWETVKNPASLGTVVDGLLLPLDELGISGVLVFFGGDTSIYTQMREMTTIWLFDVANRKWYKQDAMGEVPQARRAACAVVVPAPDRSSYQIYMYGGTDFQNTLRDIHVLTIPSFVWLRVPARGVAWPPFTWDHACTLHASRQMLIIPGDGPVSGCEKKKSVHVFDTADWLIKDTFDPTRTAVTVPAAVIDVIGGNTTGGAIRKLPLAGKFDEPGVAALFDSIQIPVSSGTSIIPTGTGLPKESGGRFDPGSGEKKGTSVGAIVGGVVGGIAGIALIWFGLIFFRRKRSRNTRTGSAELSGQMPDIPPSTEYYPTHYTQTANPNFYQGKPLLHNRSETPELPPQFNELAVDRGATYSVTSPSSANLQITGAGESYYSQRQEMEAGAIPQELGDHVEGRVVIIEGGR